MGICLHSGDSAGLFRSVHKECAERVSAAAAAPDPAEREWRQKINQAIHSGSLDHRLFAAEAKNALPFRKAELLAAEAFSARIAKMLASTEPRTFEQLDVLATFAVAFGLGSHCLPDRAWHHFVMLMVLADLDSGKFPRRIEDVELGFAFESGEQVAWCCGAVYMEDRAVVRRGVLTPESD